MGVTSWDEERVVHGTPRQGPRFVSERWSTAKSRVTRGSSGLPRAHQVSATPVSCAEARSSAPPIMCSPCAFEAGEACQTIGGMSIRSAGSSGRRMYAIGRERTAENAG